jgi:hypothetical protein
MWIEMLLILHVPSLSCCFFVCVYYCYCYEIRHYFFCYVYLCFVILGVLCGLSNKPMLAIWVVNAR